MGPSEKTVVKDMISVIIPNYNYAKFLKRRFESILSQTYSNYEIIFLDDASTDASVELVQENYRDSVNVIDVNQKNSGSPFIQWNKGVHLSHGEFIWIAEADDICAPDFLKKTVEAMIKNPSVGLVFCHTLPVDESDNILDRDSYTSYVSDLDPVRWSSNFQSQGITEVREYLFHKNTITNVSGVLFRRTAYIQAEYAPEDMHMCGDWMFYCRLLRYSDFAYISKPINFHRQHPAKHTTNSVLNLTYFREFLQVQDYLIKEFDLSHAQKRFAFRRFLREWDRLVISNYGRITFSGNLALARMTWKQYKDPREYFIILFHAILNGLKTILYKW